VTVGDWLGSLALLATAAALSWLRIRRRAA
jgi:hypothetical protein